MTEPETSDAAAYDFGTGARADTWPAEIHEVLQQFEVKQVAYVPDGGHARLIEHCRRSAAFDMLSLTTEEEGIGVATGAWLGGQRAVVLMQSSGVGNCVNLFSMLKVCTVPALVLVTMRGEWGEFVPWQIPMGQATETCFKLFDFCVLRADDAARVRETVEAGAKLAFFGGKAVAVLISQRVIGAKSFGKGAL